MFSPAALIRKDRNMQPGAAGKETSWQHAGRREPIIELPMGNSLWG